MTRPTQVVINLSALRHNFSRARALAPKSRIIAIVKADAYGHGLVQIAQALDDADTLGVACLEEAATLRSAGISKPVILLEGPYSADELLEIDPLDLEIVVHHEEQIRMLETSQLHSPVRVWLKVDTGMHRLGFDPAETTRAWQRLKACPAVNPDIRLMTHLADAGDTARDMTRTQLQIFNDACRGLDGPRSIANSAGILAWPETHADFVRPGLMLYGASPMEKELAANHDLQPVMTFQSSLIAIRRINKGEHVGYGADWCAPESMPVGVVAAGYGDGFPRHAASGAPVIINGIRSRIIGNPSMDMLTVDLRDVGAVNIGDPVELWGNTLPVEEVARYAGTVAYELLCGVHKRIKVIVNE